MSAADLVQRNGLAFSFQRSSQRMIACSSRRVRSKLLRRMRLFVHAQDQRALGRVEIEPRDIGQFEVELGVAAELESLHPMRLQPVLLPAAMHGGCRKPEPLGQPSRAPVGRGLGLAQGRADDRPLLGRTDAPRAAGACLGAQALEFRAAVAPFARPRRCWAKLPTAAPSVARPRRRRWPGSPWPAGPDPAPPSALSTTIPASPDPLPPP